MKKGKLKAEEKARKIIKASVEESLINKITVFIKELGYEPKQVKTEIVKSSKIMARRISTKTKLSKEVLIAALKLHVEPVPEHAVISENIKPQDNIQTPLASSPTQKEQVRKKLVKASSKTDNADPVIAAKETALQKAENGEPDLDERLGVS